MARRPSPLKALVSTATTLSLDAAASELQQHSELSERLGVAMTNMLPIENNAGRLIEKDRAASDRRRQQLADQLTIPYPVLDPEPFTWRDKFKEGRPKLITLPLDAEPVLGFHARWTGTWEVKPRFPEPLRHIYDAVARDIAKRAEEKDSFVVWTYTDTISIPPEVKVEIAKAKNHFTLGGMFWVGEADPSRWNVTEVRRPRNIDPIIIGIKNEAIYLIASYDMTDLETYVAAEFAAKQLTDGNKEG